MEIRCVIVDADGMTVKFGDMSISAATPDISRPHVGKHGTAKREDETFKITLDDGNILYGYECWWMPEDEWEKTHKKI